MKRFITMLLFLLAFSNVTHAQQTAKPMQLPVAQPAGPSTWLLGQAYGNTTGAFNNGRAWYSAGQGLHFGLDLSMPCGTELVAVADGEVAFVDDLGFGSAPHNLILRHPALGLTSLYGHLLETPPLAPGQFVQQGQVVALSGDPEGTCDSRPHLHLEIRSADFRTAVNPVDYIEAPWHSLSTIGPFGYPLFQQDMTHPGQWQFIDNQPDVAFGGRILNEYASTWPYNGDLQPPPNPPLPREPAPVATTFTMRKLGYDGCCVNPWWNPLDPGLLYVVDGPLGEFASIFEWSTSGEGSATRTTPGPRPLRSPDGSHELRVEGDQVFIRRLSDGADWNVQTQGVIPAISTDNSQLLWEVGTEFHLPGEPESLTEFWISDIQGQNARRILAQPGGSARWLDDARLLVSTPLAEDRAVMLSVFDTRDDSSYTLGHWRWLRGLDVAPGGERLMFYISRSTDPELTGTYTITTERGAQAEKLDWFGAWRWRDADRVYYIPFDPTTDRQSLMLYTFSTGQQQTIIDGSTTHFTVASGNWEVSPDGRKIVYVNALDRTMWLIEETP